MGISIINIRRSWDRLIFIHGNSHTGKTTSLCWDTPLLSAIWPHLVIWWPVPTNQVCCLTYAGNCCIRGLPIVIQALRVRLAVSQTNLGKSQWISVWAMTWVLQKWSVQWLCYILGIFRQYNLNKNKPNRLALSQHNLDCLWWTSQYFKLYWLKSKHFFKIFLVR